MIDGQGTTKILIFSIDGEFYGIEIDKVNEIIRFDKMTLLHDKRKSLKGVINLRGKIIPVVDFRITLGMTEKKYTDKTVFIILVVNGNNRNYNIALAVDAVHEVDTLCDSNNEKLPDLGLKLKRRYLTGIMKQKNRMVMIIDISRILNSDEVEESLDMANLL